jgi:Ca2+-binding RTX toxin-like protein
MAIIDGTTGDDSRAGGSGADIIRGLTGRDTLYGNGGADRIYGEDEDVHIGGPTSEEDTLYGGDGGDLLAAGDDNDIIVGGNGNDFMGGGVDDDVLYGGLGGDTMVGGSGNDLLTGDSSRDSLFGGDGNDILDGGKSLDTLVGSTGNDVLVGGGFRDVLTGGSGADEFVFDDHWSGGHVDYDSIPGAADQIIDFDWTQNDVIDLRLIDADIITPGDQAFTWGGEGGTDSLEKGKIIYGTPGDDFTFVQGSTNDDLGAEFMIVFDEPLTLSASDFVL